MVTASLLSACADKKNAQSQTEDFSYSVEQFADLEILRYRVPGFESLSSDKKNSFIISPKLPCKEGTFFSIKTENGICPYAARSKPYTRNIKAIKKVATSKHSKNI